MSLERKEIFEFGEFRLDADEHTIERIDGAPNRIITEKCLAGARVLLIRQRGHLVTKDEFRTPDRECRGGRRTKRREHSQNGRQVRP